MLTPFGKCVAKKKGHGPYILLDVVTSDGHVVAQKQNSPVSSELLSEIWSWKMEGATDTDISDNKQYQQDIHITIGAQVT